MFELSIKSSHKVSSISIQFGEEDGTIVMSSEPEVKNESPKKERKELSSRTPKSEKTSKPVLGAGFDMDSVDDVKKVETKSTQPISIPDVKDREQKVETTMNLESL